MELLPLPSSSSPLFSVCPGTPPGRTERVSEKGVEAQSISVHIDHVKYIYIETCAVYLKMVLLVC